MAIPIATPEELGSCWPDSAWFLVQDDAEVLAKLQRQFAQQRRSHPVVVFSDRLVPSRVVAAICGGAINYVVWPATAETIHNAIASVADMARKRCEHESSRLAAQGKLSLLTGRETDVLGRMCEGLTNKEIARALEISPRTVEIHRANALAKIGARNTAEAARTVMESRSDLSAQVAAA